MSKVVLSELHQMSTVVYVGLMYASKKCVSVNCGWSQNREQETVVMLYVAVMSSSHRSCKMLSFGITRRPISWFHVAQCWHV